MSVKRRPPFCVAGGERASPLCEGIGHHPRAFLGLRICSFWPLFWSCKNINHRSWELSLLVADGVWVSPEKQGSAPRIQKVFRGPTGLWGEELSFLEWWGASRQQGWRSAQFRARGGLVEQNHATMQEESTWGRIESTPAFGWPLFSASSGTFYPQADGWAWVSWNISHWRARL